MLGWIVDKRSGIIFVVLWSIGLGLSWFTVGSECDLSEYCEGAHHQWACSEIGFVAWIDDVMSENVDLKGMSVRTKDDKILVYWNKCVIQRFLSGRNIFW